MIQVFIFPSFPSSETLELSFIIPFFLAWESAPTQAGIKRVSFLEKVKSESRSVVSNSLGPHGLYSPWNSLGQSTRVGSRALLQRIFPTQGLNPGLLHCRQILYQLNHKGSPRTLEWVAYPFSSGSPQAGVEPGSPALQADSLPTELPGKL